jgi:4-amino-4-deoxy-L-arabinose transferase-like glycosyltransferase
LTTRVFTLGFLLVIAVLYCGSLNRLSLTDPDEVFYSQTAKEMMQQGSYATPLIFGRPQYEKPPLFYWLLMAAFEIAGVTRAAARFVPLLSGLLGIFATFYFCRRVLNQEIAWLAGILLATSAIYLALSEAVLTDITLSVLMMVALHAFYLWTLERRDLYLYAYGVAAALAVLTKGPVAIIILFLVAALFLTISREFNLLRRFLIHPWALLFCAVSVPWYADVLARDGKPFFSEFIVHDNIDRILHAEHPSFDHWWFYPATALVGLFPWTFDLAVMGRRWKEYKREYLFFLTWFAVTFAVFEIAASKLASYILPLFPAIVIPLAISLSDVKPRSRSRYALSAMQIVPGIALIVLPSIMAPEIGGINTAGSAIGIRALGAALIAGAFFFWRGRIKAAILTKALGVAALVLVLGSSLSPAVDCEVADAFVKNIVIQERYGDQVILTDRRYARGVYFYTGNPVVVMDHNKQPFWSPHPLEVITSREEIESFFAGRDRVLCVVNNSDAKELDRMFEGRRISRPIAHDGDKIVLMSEKTPG